MAEENTITLRRSDGQEFLISKSAVILSETIKAMVEEDDSSSLFPIAPIDSKTLADFITFLNKRVDSVMMMIRRKVVTMSLLRAGKEWNDLGNLVLAANYLDIKDLLDIICEKIADKMKDKSVMWVRKNFQIQNDFSPEEEEKVREEYAWAFEGVEDD